MPIKQIREVHERQSYVHELVVIDGIMRSGKALHDALVSSLERSEMWQHSPMIDSIPILYRSGHLSYSASVNLLRREIDMLLYHGMIGRGSNFRREDASSIWKSKDPQTYINRAESESEVEILNKILNKDVKPIFNLSAHDILCSSPDVFFDAYPNLRMISGRRNPIEIVYAWHQKNWGNRIGIEERSLALAFEGNRGPIPWFATDWSDEYESLSLPMDRIIYGIDWLIKERMNNYRNLSKDKKEQVFIPSFEWVVTQPNDYLKQVCLHVKSVKSPFTDRIMKEENVPRILTRSNLNMQINEIKKNASKKAFNRLMEIQDDYHKDSKEYFQLDTSNMWS